MIQIFLILPIKNLKKLNSSLQPVGGYLNKTSWKKTGRVRFDVATEKEAGI